MAMALVTVKASASFGAASRWRAGMAKADPMRVCGLVKRQRTTGKGSFLVFSDDEDKDEDEADDIWSSPPASAAAATALEFNALRAVLSAFVKAIVLDVERFSFNDVGI